MSSLLGTPYAVSLVDGFNLPIAVTPSATSCHEASCPVNLNAICPAPLQGPFDPSGAVVGCKTACGAGLAPDPSECVFVRVGPVWRRRVVVP